MKFLILLARALLERLLFVPVQHPWLSGECSCKVIILFVESSRILLSHLDTQYLVAVLPEDFDIFQFLPSSCQVM